MHRRKPPKKRVGAYGGPGYQLNSQVLMRFAEAIGKGQVQIVPNVVVSGSNSRSGAGNMVEMLLAMLVAEKAEKKEPPKAA